MALLKRRRAFTRWKVVGVLALCTLACGSGSGRDSTKRLSFESSPRAVLDSLGISASRDAQLAISSSGMLSMLAVHQAAGKNRLGFTMSHDGGDHFMPMVPVNEPDTQVSSHGENSPVLATSATAIYALYEQARTDGGSDLMMARSLNFGHSFDKAVRITDGDKPSFHGFSSLAIAPNGDVYAVWLDGRDSRENPETFDLYLVRSDDHGATFGRNTRVARLACPCCRPRIAFGSRGEVYIAWRKDFPGDIRDMVLSVSRDGGKSFAPERRIAQDNWRLRGCPDSGPSLIVNAGRLYVSWLTVREGRATIQLAWSDDAGLHFQGPFATSGKVLDPNHPILARSEDGRVFLAFQGREPTSGNGQWNPLATFLAQIQSPISAPQMLPNGGVTASHPTLAAGTAGSLFVAWTSAADNGNAIQLLRGRLE